MKDFFVLKGFCKDLGESKTGRLGKFKYYKKQNYIYFSFWYGEKLIDAYATLDNDRTITSIYYDSISLLYEYSSNELNFNLSEKFIKNFNYKISKFLNRDMIQDEIDLEEANKYNLCPCLYCIVKFINCLNIFFDKVYRDISYATAYKSVSRGYSWLKTLDMVISIPTLFLGTILLVFGLVLIPINLVLIIFGSIFLSIALVFVVFALINRGYIRKINLCSSKKDKK